MAVDFGLLGNPVNPLQVLQSLALGQQQVQQRQQMEEERANKQRELALREQQFGLQQRKLQADTRKTGLEGYAEAIQDVLRRPENERASTWDAYVDQFVAMGQPEAAQLKGRYSEQAARAMLAQAGKLSDFNKDAEVKYVPVAAGGKLQGFQYGQPLGGGQAPQSTGPQPGVVEDGYRFKGGNPADPSSWEQVGGQTPRASGGF